MSAQLADALENALSLCVVGCLLRRVGWCEQWVLGTAPHENNSKLVTDGRDISAQYPDHVIYLAESVVGSGAFGNVYLCQRIEGKNRERVAVKKVLQDERYKVCRNCLSETGG